MVVWLPGCSCLVAVVWLSGCGCLVTVVWWPEDQKGETCKSRRKEEEDATAAGEMKKGRAARGESAHRIKRSRL